MAHKSPHSHKKGTKAESLGERLSRSLDIPPDVLPGSSLITINVAKVCHDHKNYFRRVSIVFLSCPFGIAPRLICGVPSIGIKNSVGTERTPK